MDEESRPMWDVGDRDGNDVRAGFTSFNLIIETEIMVITKASHALVISEWSWSFVLDD